MHKTQYQLENDNQKKIYKAYVNKLIKMKIMRKTQYVIKNKKSCIRRNISKKTIIKKRFTKPM